MASKDNQGNFRGRIGNLTYRVINGVNVIQSRPGPNLMKQTSATQSSSTDFSVASNRAKIIRTILYPMIKDHFDRQMVNRFNALMGDVIRSNEDLAPGQRDLGDGQLSLLNGFDFNVRSPFANYFKLDFVQQFSPWGLRLTLPAFNPNAMVNFPQGATGCNLRVLVSALDLDQNKYCYCDSRELEILTAERMVAATDWFFNAHLPDHALVMATVSLEFYTEGLMEDISLNGPALHPCMILCLHKTAEMEDQHHEMDPIDVWGKWHSIAGIDGNKLKAK